MTISRPNKEAYQSAMAELNVEISTLLNEMKEFEMPLKEASLQSEREESQKQFQSLLGLKQKAIERQKQIIVKSKELQKTPRDDLEGKLVTLEKAILKGFRTLKEEKECIQEISSLKKLVVSQRTGKQQKLELEKELVLVNLKIQETNEKLNLLKEVQSKLQNKLQKEYKAKQEFMALKKQKNDLLREKKQEKQALYESFKEQQNMFFEHQRAMKQEFEHQRKTQESTKQVKKLQQAIEDSSIKAFEGEINLINALIKFFKFKETIEPIEKTKEQKDLSLLGPNQKATMMPMKKDREQDFFIATKTIKKSSKKQKQKSFKLDLKMMDQLEFLGVTVPMTTNDIPTVVEKLELKREEFQAQSEEQTEKNKQEAFEKFEKLKSDLGQEFVDEVVATLEASSAF
jgi:hypothetical protein